jgi:hypothetical protein
MEQHEVVKLFAEVSVLGIICYFFIRFALNRMQAADKDAKEREDRIASRVSNLETFINEKLMALVENSTNALAANTSALERTYGALEKAEDIALKTHTATIRLIERMESNPCLLGNRDEQTTRIAGELADKLKDAGRKDTDIPPP